MEEADGPSLPVSPEKLKLRGSVEDWWKLVVTAIGVIFPVV